MRLASPPCAEEVEGRVRAGLEAELGPLFGGESRRVAFGGYVQALRRF